MYLVIRSFESRFDHYILEMTVSTILTVVEAHALEQAQGREDPTFLCAPKLYRRLVSIYTLGYHNCSQ